MSSVLQFTYELNINYKILFLDIFINSNSNKFTTSIYKKNHLQ